MEILLIAIVVAAACALPGVFLVLRRLALLSDAITHAVLLGIVIAFFFTRVLSSPWLLIGAALTGVLTASLVELLHRTGTVREDAAIGLIFPALFSLGVILISRTAAKDVHLDTDAVLMGNLELSVNYRFEPWGEDLGPISLYVMGPILLVNLLFILVFYKELKLATFDASLATALGFSPAILHYALMTLVSVTAVGAFDAVGSVLVVAFMIVPPATAYLLTDRLWRMLLRSVEIAVVNATLGYWLARYLDANIAGSIAAVSGAVFGLVFLLAPERGLLALARRRLRQRWEFAQTMLAIHLLNHEGLAEAEEECRVDRLHEHLRWEPGFLSRVIRRAERQGLVRSAESRLKLTRAGQELARRAQMT
jgi:manganese/zinc/iron transport system permease protein